MASGLGKLGSAFTLLNRITDPYDQYRKAGTDAYKQNQDLLKATRINQAAKVGNVLGGSAAPSASVGPVGAGLSKEKMMEQARSVRPMGVPSYKKGTKRVPKTGPAILHKDEAVLNKKEAKRYRSGGLSLGGKKKSPKTPRAKAKIKKTMDEWKAGTLHSGSKTGPKVTNQRQAIAIALSQARRKA